MSEKRIDVKYFYDEFCKELIILDAENQVRKARELSIYGFSIEEVPREQRKISRERFYGIGAAELAVEYEKGARFPKKMGRPLKTATEAVIDYRKQPRVTAERIAKVRNYLDQGRNSREISVLIGIDLELVNKIIIKLRDKSGAPKDGDDDYLVKK